MFYLLLRLTGQETPSQVLLNGEPMERGIIFQILLLNASTNF